MTLCARTSALRPWMTRRAAASSLHCLSMAVRASDISFAILNHSSFSYSTPVVVYLTVSFPSSGEHMLDMSALRLAQRLSSANTVAQSRWRRRSGLWRTPRQSWACMHLPCRSPPWSRCSSMLWAAAAALMASRPKTWMTRASCHRSCPNVSFAAELCWDSNVPIGRHSSRALSLSLHENEGTRFFGRKHAAGM